MPKTAEEIVMGNLKTIEEWTLQGMTQKEIAECLGIGESTFRKLKRENVALLAVLKKCANQKKKFQDEQVKQVEESLFKRATGYNIKEEVVTKVKDTYYDDQGHKCTKEDVIVSEVTKHIPADVNAAKFFLLNKAKKIWNNDPNKLEIDKENLKLKKKEIESKVID